MAEFPALPLFTDAYLADTRHLSTEEHGAYLLLLMCAWRTRGCALKDDDKFLARIVGVSSHRWRRIKPVMREFFDVYDGMWRQKKLLDVYRGVETRVAKNRANGARGGRAKAAKVRTSRQAAGSSAASGDAMPNQVATKTRLQTPKVAAELTHTEKVFQEPPADSVAAVDDSLLLGLADRAGLAVESLDISVPAMWLAAGASPQADIFPTISRLRQRQEKRKGDVPASLAYYSAAILDARDKRLGAVASGQQHALDRPAAMPKHNFDPNNIDHWRLFLGDPKSRFRGDYLSANWAIGSENPNFCARPLGSDPRAAINDLIPTEIMREYGAAWHWCRRDDDIDANNNNQSDKEMDL